jgi:hypothetical protein
MNPSIRFFLNTLLCLLTIGPASHTCAGQGNPEKGNGAVPPKTVTAPPSLPQVSLTILSEGAVKGGNSGTGKCDLGVIASGAQAHCKFTLKNDSTQVIPFQRVQASCGCQTLKISKRGVPVTQTVLNPGEQIEVEVAINSRGMHGNIRKFAWVFGFAKEPIATLEIEGTVHDAVTFDPPVLDFGKGPAGSSHTLLLTVTAEESVVRNHIFPPLQSDSKDIRIQPMDPLQHITLEGKSFFQQKYSIELLSGASNGAMSGRIFFPPASSSAPGILSTGNSAPLQKSSQPSHPKEVLSKQDQESDSAFATVGAFVRGEIRGDIKAAPELVYFGNVNLPVTRQRKIVLSGASLTIMNGLTLSSDNPLVLVSLTKTEVAGSSGQVFMRLLEVSLSPKTKSGTLRATITVTSPSGERIILPVSAELQQEKERDK